MGRRKVLEGTIVSDKLDKTRVVLVTRKSLHVLYKKMVTKRKKYKIHDEKNTSKAGDKVRIIESRPYSKGKKFKLVEIIK